MALYNTVVLLSLKMCSYLSPIVLLLVNQYIMFVSKDVLSSLLRQSAIFWRSTERHSDGALYSLITGTQPVGGVEWGRRDGTGE